MKYLFGCVCVCVCERVSALATTKPWPTKAWSQACLVSGKKQVRGEGLLNHEDGSGDQNRVVEDATGEVVLQPFHRFRQ